MSIAPSIAIPLTPRAIALMEKYAAMPLTITRAVAAGLDEAMPLVLAKVTTERLTGQGPFPVAEHRLGVRSGQLREGAYVSPAQIAGPAVTARIGSPVFYAGIHEFGATFQRTSKPGTVRLATDRRGALLRNGPLAIFAKKNRKTAREVSYAGGKTYEVHVPARHAFGFGVSDSIPIITEKVSAHVATALDPKGETTP